MNAAYLENVLGFAGSKLTIGQMNACMKIKQVEYTTWIVKSKHLLFFLSLPKSLGQRVYKKYSVLASKSRCTFELILVDIAVFGQSEKRIF